MRNACCEMQWNACKSRKLFVDSSIDSDGPSPPGFVYHTIHKWLAQIIGGSMQKKNVAEINRNHSLCGRGRAALFSTFFRYAIVAKL